MNRKLHNTILAFSVTGVMLVAGLIAAGPAPQRGDQPEPVEVAAPAQDVPAVDVPDHVPADTAAAEALAARINARSQRYEAAFARAEGFDEAATLTAGFIAAVATEAAVAGALEGLGADAEKRVEKQNEKDNVRRRRSSGSVRSSIAVPYFSFARGIDRGDRS